MQGASSRRRFAAWGAAGLVLAAGLVWWTLRPAPEPRARVRRLWAGPGIAKPNLLLVTLDTTRADRLGAYGHPGGLTPSLDALAARGALFARATAPAPLTLPAHASIMTGTYPTYHGVRVNGNAALSQSQTTLAEVLQRAGYATGAFVSAFVLDGRWGLNQGFDVYDDRFDLEQHRRLDLGSVQRPGNEVVDAALAWLADRKRTPFFAWIHLYDAHTPYAPPEPFLSQHRARGLVGLYEGEIAFADQQVGRCLDWLRANGHENDTVVAAVGDHGEALGSHGEASHGYFVYDDTLRVPLLIAAPLDGLRGVRVAAPVSSVDLYPTLLDLLGIAPPAGVQHGRSLLPLMFDPARTEPAYAYAESMTPQIQFGWSALHMLRGERYKLIDAPRPELYDLSADPGETRNLVGQEAEVATDLRRRLRALMEETAQGAPEPEAADLDKETLEGLAALGYVGAPARSRPSGSDAALADPKDKLRVFAAVQMAGELIMAEKASEAAATLEAALAEEPRMPQALLMLGGAYSDLGRTREAKAQFDAVLEDDPHSVQALIGVASLLMREGRTGEVIALCKRTLSLDDRNVRAHALLGEVYVDRGRPMEALPHFEQAVAIQPKLTQNQLNLAGALIETGRLDQAAALLERITAEHPRFPLAQFHLGLAREQQGRWAEARAAYAAEVEAFPGHFKARFNLGKLLWETGDRDAALSQMREVIRIAPRRAEGHLMLARGLLQQGAPLDEVQALAEKGLGLAESADMKRLGWLLMADVWNRRREPARMNEALRQADRYASSARREVAHARPR